MTRLISSEKKTERVLSTQMVTLNRSLMLLVWNSCCYTTWQPANFKVIHFCGTM